MFLQISRIGALSATVALRILTRSDFGFIAECRADSKCSSASEAGRLTLLVCTCLKMRLLLQEHLDTESSPIGMDKNQFSQDPRRIVYSNMARQNKKPDTFGDDEYNQAMEEA